MSSRILLPWLAFRIVLLGITANGAVAQSEEALYDYQVCCAGDVADDGTSEFLIGRSGFSTVHRDQPWFDCGSLNLCSFKKQNGVLARATSADIEDRFGESLAVIELAGKSSEGTCLAGEPGFDHGRGRLLLFSTAKLERLRTIEGSTAGRGFGAKVLIPEKDGGPKRIGLVSCEPAAPVCSPTTDRSSIVLLSLETWTVVAEHAFEMGEKLGRCGLVWIPDQDADGSSDVALGIINGTNGSGETVGRVEIRSGKTLALLATIHGTEAGSEFGASIAPIRSNTDPTRSDLLIGAPGYRQPMISGAIASLFRLDLGSKELRPAFETPNLESRAGESVVSLGDIDGDGKSDIALGAPWDFYLMQSECGVTWVLSGAVAVDETRPELIDPRAVISRGSWRFKDTRSHGLRFDGFGARLSTFDIVRKGKPCSVLAVASQQARSWIDGVVFFDIARIAKSDRLEEAVLWEAAHVGKLELRTFAGR